MVRVRVFDVVAVIRWKLGKTAVGDSSRLKKVKGNRGTHETERATGESRAPELLTVRLGKTREPDLLTQVLDLDIK